MNRIKEVLEQKGIKQFWLAEQLGMSYNMVNAYAQNWRQPSLEDLYKVAEILNVDIKELIVSNKPQWKSRWNEPNIQAKQWHNCIILIPCKRVIKSTSRIRYCHRTMLPFATI